MTFSTLSVQTWSEGSVVLYSDNNYYHIDSCDNEESYVLIGPVRLKCPPMLGPVGPNEVTF